MEVWQGNDCSCHDSRGGSCNGVRPHEVFLLGFEHDSAHEIHAHGRVVEVLVMNSVKGRAHTDNEVSHTDGDGMDPSMEQVHEQGTAIELLGSNLGRAWEAYVRRDKAACVS